MKKILRYSIKGLLILLSTVLLLAIVLPILYKDEIIQLVKTELSRNIEGECTIGKGSISLFNHFPNLEIGLSEVYLQGNALAPETSDTLLYLNSLAVTTDIRSLFKRDVPIQIRGVYADEGVLNINQSKSGIANYQIFRTQSEPRKKESPALEFQVEDFKVTDLNLTYKDEGSAFSLFMNDIDLHGAVAIQSQDFQVVSDLSAGEVDLISNGIEYASDLILKSGIQFDISNTMTQIMVNTDELTLNQMPFELDGKFITEKETVNIDLEVSNKGDRFGDLLSILPNAYTREFKNLESKGNVQFNAKIKGDYAPKKGSYPRYDADLIVKDGYFKYPQFQFPVSNIQLNAHVSNGNSLRVAKILVPGFQLLLNGEKVNGSAEISNMDGNAKIHSQVEGRINLTDLHNAYPFPQFTKMTGLVDFDWLIDADQNSIQSESWSDIDVNGKTRLSNVIIESASSPAVSIEANILTNSETMTIDNSMIEYGKSDFALNGTIDGWLGILDSLQMISANLSINGDHLDVNEITGGETQDRASYRDSLIRASIPRFSTHGMINFKSVLYTSYLLEDLQAEIQWDDERIKILDGQLNANDSRATMKGELNNIFGYVFGGENLEGEIDIETDQIIIDKWMATGTDANASATNNAKFVKIPENLALDLILEPTLVKYNTLDFENLKGNIIVDSGQVSFQNIVAETLSGNVKADGYYNSENIEHPAFGVKFEGGSLGMQAAFQKLPLLQKYAPLLRFVDGVFNSSSVMEGQLGTGYLPIWESLTASGFLETVHTDLGRLGILKKIGEKLSISEITRLNLDGTKNWFEITNGVLNLKRFDVKAGEIELNIGGKYALTGELDFLLDIRLPASIIEGNKIFQTVDAQWKPLRNKLNQLGLDIGDLQHADIAVTVKGMAKDPQISWKVTNIQTGNLEDQVTQVIDDKIDEVQDSVHQVIEDKISEAQDSAENYIENVIDSVQQSAEEQIESVKDSILESVKDQASGVLDSIAVNAGKDILKDILKSDSTSQDSSVDELKKKLKDFNPFKKKKKVGL